MIRWINLSGSSFCSPLLPLREDWDGNIPWLKSTRLTSVLTHLVHLTHLDSFVSSLGFSLKSSMKLGLQASKLALHTLGSILEESLKYNVKSDSPATVCGQQDNILTPMSVPFTATKALCDPARAGFSSLISVTEPLPTHSLPPPQTADGSRTHRDVYTSLLLLVSAPHNHAASLYLSHPPLLTDN